MATRAQGRATPVDLEHLAAQTGRNADLERQVLEMFLSQLPQDIACLKTMASRGPGATVSEMAHRIVGSARAVGAFAVADAAAEIEQAGSAEFDRLSALEGAFEVARGFIAHYLAG